MVVMRSDTRVAELPVRTVVSDGRNVECQRLNGGVPLTGRFGWRGVMLVGVGGQTNKSLRRTSYLEMHGNKTKSLCNCNGSRTRSEVQSSVLLFAHGGKLSMMRLVDLLDPCGVDTTGSLDKFISDKSRGMEHFGRGWVTAWVICTHTRR